MVGKAKCCVSGDENEKLLTYTVRLHEQSFDWRGEKTKSGKKQTKSKPLRQATKKKKQIKKKIKKYKL